MTPEELLKEVGEPVGLFDVYNGDSYIQIKPEYSDETTVKLYTFDQVAAAIAKATKPLEEEIERLQEEDNLPVRYYQPNGKGPVYAVYGSSSIDFVEELRAQLAAAQEEMNDWRNQAHQSQSAFDRLQDQLAKAEQRVAELIPGNGKELSERMKRLATNSVWRYSADQNKPVDMSDPNIQELFAIIDHLCIGLDSPAIGASS